MLIDKVPDVANLGFASLVFGQAFSGEPFSIRWALIGTLVWFALFGAVIAAARGERS